MINAYAQWRDGQRVTGTYCDKPFSGTLTERSRPTPDYRNIIFQVALDSPIMVYGESRDTVEVWTNSKFDTIDFEATK